MVDVNKPIENPALVEAIESFQKEQTRENELRMIEQLKQAHFLMVFDGKLIHDEPAVDGKIMLKKGSTLNFPMLTNSNGEMVHFAFTDWPSLYQWKNEPNQQTLIVPFADLPDMVLSEKVNCSGVVINPNSHNLYIDRQRLASICGRVNTYTVKQNTQVLLGEPSNYPKAMVDAVTKAIKPLREVKKAWLLLMTKDNEQSYLIIVDFKGDRSKVSNTIGQAAIAHLNGMFLDIVDANDSFGRTSIQGHKPFYHRSLFG